MGDRKKEKPKEFPRQEIQPVVARPVGPEEGTRTIVKRVIQPVVAKPIGPEEGTRIVRKFARKKSG